MIYPPYVSETAQTSRFNTSIVWLGELRALFPTMQTPGLIAATAAAIGVEKDVPSWSLYVALQHWKVSSSGRPDGHSPSTCSPGNMKFGRLYFGDGLKPEGRPCEFEEKTQTTPSLPGPEI